jgi:hypothetical protein
LFQLPPFPNLVIQVDLSDLTMSASPQAPAQPQYHQPQQQQYQPQLRQVAAQGVPPSWQTPPPAIPKQQQFVTVTTPIAPPPPPVIQQQPTRVSQPQQVQHQLVVTAPPQPVVTQAQPTVSEDSGSGATIIYEGEQMKASWRDFPCALRNFKKAQVTTTCEIDCGDAECARAVKVCEGYVECHGIVIKGASRGENLVQASAVLKSDSERSRDNSLQLLKASSWFQSTSLTSTIKPRYYIVNSYGGCGSKMMAGWLSQLPAMYKKSVYHYHDPKPPQQLHSMANNKAANPSIKGSKNDFRSGRFPGGSKFKVLPTTFPHHSSHQRYFLNDIQ